VLLIAARAFGELAVRLGQPALVGELLSGVVLGMVAQRFEGVFPRLAGLDENEVFLALADLGVFFLMLLAGMEMRLTSLTRGSLGAFGIAVGGLLVPLAGGVALGWVFLPASGYLAAQALFLGTALAITAVPVAVRVLMELGALETRPGRLIVAAAIIDDILSLLLLAVLTAVLRSGEVPAASDLAVLGGSVLAFFAITAVLGIWVLPRLQRLLERVVGDELEFSILVIVALGFALLAEALRMHFIIGAFVAGLLFGRRTMEAEIFEDVKRKVSGLTSGFLAPLFFVSIGLHFDPGAVAAVPGFVALLLVVAVLGKLVGAGVPALVAGLGRRGALVVGVGMSARGAVELIIADIALRAGLFSHPDPAPPVVANLFSAVVLMAIVTTLAAPIGLRALQAHGEVGDD